VFEFRDPETEEFLESIPVVETVGDGSVAEVGADVVENDTHDVNDGGRGEKVIFLGGETGLGGVGCWFGIPDVLEGVMVGWVFMVRVLRVAGGSGEIEGGDFFFVLGQKVRESARGAGGVLVGVVSDPGACVVLRGRPGADLVLQKV
jgi:hypothetical protein